MNGSRVLSCRKRKRGEASLVASPCEIPSSSRSDGSAYFSSGVIISMLASEGAVTDTAYSKLYCLDLTNAFLSLAWRRQVILASEGLFINPVRDVESISPKRSIVCKHDSV